MGLVGAYGVRIYPYGVEFRTDGRKGMRLPGGLDLVEEDPTRRGGPRGRIRAYSRSSAKRLAMLVANAGAEFRTFITLTYRGTQMDGEGDRARNQRIVRRSKVDLHRFIVCLGDELGLYVWIQEFQARGVLHYHMLCENRVPVERAKEAWLRAIGSLGDVAAWEHGVKADAIEDQRQVRKYLGHYLVKARGKVFGADRQGKRSGKAVQKELPEGVEGAGRWWGASRSLKPTILEEVISLYKEEGIRRYGELQTARCLRRYVGKVWGTRFESGAFLDWGGELSAKMVRMTGRLREYFGVTARLAEMSCVEGRSDGWGAQGIELVGASEGSSEHDGGGRGCSGSAGKGGGGSSEAA